MKMTSAVFTPNGIICQGSKRAGFHTGFTFVEMVVVLGIIVALMAMTIPYFLNFLGSSNIKGAQEGIVSALRTTRSYAISQNVRYQLTCDKVASSYKIERLVSTGNLTIDKTYLLPQGVSFSAAYTIIFESNGGLAVASGPCNTIVITDRKGVTKTITVNKATGAIDVTP